MRCRRSSKKKVPGKCGGPKVDGTGIQFLTEKMKRSASGRTLRGKKEGPNRRGIGLVQKVFGICSVPSATEADERLQTRK